MKKRFLYDFDWEAVLLVFLVTAAGTLALLSIILAVACSNLNWLWLWLPAALCISLAAGMGW